MSKGRNREQGSRCMAFLNSNAEALHATDKRQRHEYKLNAQKPF